MLSAPSSWRCKPHMRSRWGLRRSFQKEQVVDELTVEDNVGVVLDSLPLSSAERERHSPRRSSSAASSVRHERAARASMPSSGG